MSRVVKILSIDGGGIRGLIPALILAEIEQRTQRPIADLFDLIVGTSTGGVIALGLTKPDATGKPVYSASDLATLYRTKGDQIFSRSPLRRFTSFGNIIDEKYDSKGIEHFLQDYFGSTQLKDVLTNVLITSYEIERRFPFFFKSERAQRDEHYDFPMWQVARATTAAPTYFEPLQIEIEGHQDYYALIDGGVFANNPAMCGYVEAQRMYPDANDMLVVSLGTGSITRRLSLDAAQGWGVLEWAQPILGIAFDGVSSTVDYQLQMLLPQNGTGRRYYRFQTRLDEENDDLDDIRPENLRVIQILAESIIRNNGALIHDLCEQLTT
ncbi:MAG: CBASS cGAMP-activated phospholipase [Chloroflexota bacterium]